MAARVIKIATKLTYGAVPTNVNSMVEISSAKSWPLRATETVTDSL